MFKATILLFVLFVSSAVVDASGHSHGGLSAAHLRGVHRRHHAKIQAAGEPRTVRRRRSCAVGASSTALDASSSVPSATSAIADPVTTTAVTSPIADADPSSTASAKSTSSTVAPGADSATSEPASSSSSSSASAEKPAASTNNAAAASADTNLRAIFPISANTKWTTSQLSGAALPLSDATLRPKNVLTRLSHDYVTMAGKKAMRAHYAAGSWNFQQEPLGGFSFYAPGPAEIDLTTAKEATLSYSVFFEEGFEFVMGGKLPGFYGGDSESGSISCSGGRRDASCFSSRFMWRTNGEMELYTYLPPTFDANQAVCKIPPHSDCNTKYGASVGRGIVSFTPGEWMTLAQRVRLNDVGKENGEIEVFANGKSLFTASGLVLRDSDAGRIRGIQAQTFFGGSTRAWASPKDQNSYFADFSVAVTQHL